MKLDFENFLTEKHAEQYIGTKNTMIDDFNKWVQDLSYDDFIKYGNEFVTQIKSKLLGKLPNELSYISAGNATSGFIAGSNTCLSQVKQIMEEIL